MKMRDIVENLDKRGTHNPSKSVIKRRVRKVEALRSAHEAGYRRGKDESDRDLNRRHDAEMNKLRNEIASAIDETVATMDREFVKGLLDVVAHHNATSPNAKIFVLSTRVLNAVARELSRAYATEGRSA